MPNLQFKIKPGLSFYAPSGVGAGDSLKPLLEYAREKVGGCSRAVAGGAGQGGAGSVIGVQGSSRVAVAGVRGRMIGGRGTMSAGQ